MENSRNFLDLENSSSYVVEELHAPSTLSDNVWSQRHARDHATVSQSTSLSGYSSNSTAVARTTFVTAAGSGCTVIEHSQPDQQLNGGESPDLLDLDKQSFYDEHGDVKPFKTEPVHSEHHYRQANCFSTGEAGVGNDTYMESWLIEQIRSEIQYDCARLTISPGEFSSNYPPPLSIPYTHYSLFIHHFMQLCSCKLEINFFADNVCRPDPYSLNLVLASIPKANLSPCIYRLFLHVFTDSFSICLQTLSPCAYRFSSYLQTLLSRNGVCVSWTSIGQTE